MTEHRLQDLLEERVADLAPVDLVGGALARASDVRRRRRTVAGVVVAVVAVVGAATVVATGGGDEPAPPPATSPTPGESDPAPSGGAEPGPEAKRAGTYAGASVWWAPTAAEEADLPVLPDSPLPAEVDLSGATGGEIGEPVVGLFGGRGNDAFVLTVTARVVRVDTSGLERVADEDGNVRSPVSSYGLSPDGRRAFFIQESSLEVRDFLTGEWTTIDTPDWLAEGARWLTEDEIWVPERLGETSAGTVHTLGGDESAADVDWVQGWLGDGDEPWGPVASGPSSTAQAAFLKGPVNGGGVTNPQGILASRGSDRFVLALDYGFPPDGTRMKGCCLALGWVDEDTVLFSSSSSEGERLLAWDVGTSRMYRVADVVGPGGVAAIRVSAPVDAGNHEDADAFGADAVVDGVPVWWSPSLAEERELPWVEESVLPRDIDVAAAAETATILSPAADAPPAIAAFPYPSPQDPTWIVLIAADGSIRRLHVGADLRTWRDANSVHDIATRSMLSPDGRHLAFPQPRSVWIVDVTTGQWSQIPVDGPTAYFFWLDDRHLLFPPEGGTSGPMYDISGRLVNADSGVGPIQLFEEEPTVRPEAPLRTNSFGAAAAPGVGGVRLPVPDEGSGRYASHPGYIAVTGLGEHALAMIHEVDDERSVVGPVVAGWLDEDTLLYESATDESYQLIAWSVGTRDFERVMTIDPPSIQTFFGGPSYADLSRL